MNNQIMLIFGALYAGVNALAFALMLYDKSQSGYARKKRIPESLLFFLSALFGSLGVLLGMLVARHKIQKTFFLVGVPMMLGQNIATLYLIYQWFAAV